MFCSFGGGKAGKKPNTVWTIISTNYYNSNTSLTRTISLVLLFVNI